MWAPSVLLWVACRLQARRPSLAPDLRWQECVLFFTMQDDACLWKDAMVFLASMGCKIKRELVWLQVRLRELQVKAAVHTCGSFSIIVCSRTLKISDDRACSAAPSQAPPVISIGQDLPTMSSGLRHVDSLHVRHRSRISVGSTQQVWHNGAPTDCHTAHLCFCTRMLFRLLVMKPLSY